MGGKRSVERGTHGDSARPLLIISHVGLGYVSSGRGKAVFPAVPFVPLALASGTKQCLKGQPAILSLKVSSNPPPSLSAA